MNAQEATPKAGAPFSKAKLAQYVDDEFSFHGRAEEVKRFCLDRFGGAESVSREKAGVLLHGAISTFGES